MKYLSLILLLLSFNAFAGDTFCGNTDGEINQFWLNFTVPFMRESNELMVRDDYHLWNAIKIYNNETELYTLSTFSVAGQVMNIRLWTRCDINRLKLTLTDVDGRESIFSNEVTIDYTAPKTGVIECAPQL